MMSMLGSALGGEYDSAVAHGLAGKEAFVSKLQGHEERKTAVW